jgi:hypothetical protein
LVRKGVPTVVEAARQRFDYRMKSTARIRRTPSNEMNQDVLNFGHAEKLAWIQRRSTTSKGKTGRVLGEEQRLGALAVKALPESGKDALQSSWAESAGR